jgi:hypothetical protein
MIKAPVELHGEALFAHIKDIAEKVWEDKVEKFARDAAAVESTNKAVVECAKTETAGMASESSSERVKVETMSKEERKVRAHAFVKLARTYQDG